MAHMQTDQSLHLLNEAGECGPFVARAEAAGQEANAAAAEGASQQLAAAQQPAAAQAMQEGGRAVSRSSSKTSEKSEGSKMRAMLRVEL